MANLTNSPVQQLTFTLERRKSYSFGFIVKLADGTPVDLTGHIIRFVLKDASYDYDDFDVTNIIVNSEATLSDAVNGTGIFAFQAAELDKDPGEYSYTITMWTPDGYSMALAKGIVNLQENPESDSMHLMYSTTTPAASLELTIRGKDVVTIVASNLVRGPDGPEGPRGKDGPEGPRGKDGFRGPQGLPADPVESVLLTKGIAYHLPLFYQPQMIHEVVFLQDPVGGHVATFGGAPLALDSTPNSVTPVQFWPHPSGGLIVTYPAL